jgi:mono/diheme cytochrome c family protein
MKLRIFIAAAILVGTIASSAAQNPKVRQRDPEWTAPPDAAEKTNPLANRPETAAGGRKLFHQRCSTCHGDDARGTSWGPDLTTRAVQAQADGELFWKITSGNTRTGMPTFSFLPELQRWQLVLHIRGHAGKSGDRR